MVAPVRRHRPTLLVGAAYLVLLAVIGVWPRHVDSGLALTEQPLTRSLAALTTLSPERIVALAEVLANAVLFVPLGLLVAWWWPRAAWWVAGCVALAAALVIEVAQQLAPIARTPSVIDVGVNVAGACAGFLVARAAVARPRYRVPLLAAVGAVVAVVLGVLVWGLVTPPA